MLKGEKLKYFALFFSLVLFFLILFIGEKKLKEEQEISFVNFLDKVKKGEVKEINIESDSNIIFVTKDEKIFRTSKDPNSSLWEVFEKEKIPKNDYLNIKINKKPDFSLGQLLLSFILNVLPVAIIIWFIWQMFRQTQKGTSQIFSFGKSGIKVYNPDDPNKVTFKDIADLEEAKQELMEVVEFLKNPDKFLKIGAKIPKGVLLVGPPGSGKCVVGDTLIFTNKGIMEIREIPKYFYVDKFTNKVEGAYLTTLDLENLEKVQDKAIYFYELPETETIKITTKQGFELEGTPEHPIIVLDNDGKLIFKTLQDVNIGDIAAIKFNTQIFGNLEEITEEEAYIMGILTGDGNLSASSRLELTTADKELAEIFVNYFKNNYPEYSVFTRPQYTRNRNKSIVYGISSWPAKKRFFEKGMSCFISYDKYVPTSIMMGSKKIVVSFLRGLFDSDGYVEKNRGSVGLSSVSKKLIYQVAMLLLNLGIVPSIRAKHRVDGRHLRDVYSLTISGTHLLKFAKEIGFGLPRKQKELENYLYTRWKGNTNVDVFYNIGEIVNTAWKEISQKRLSNSWLAYIADKTRDKNRISRNTLIRFIEELESKNATSDEFYYLKKLLEADLYFVPIVKKEYSKNKVYDFTVEKSHSFISNGFISHNTLLARATAAEAGVPFFYISGSEFVELFVGIGASRVRDAFAVAKRNQPSILFIDEIDAIGKVRGVGITGGHEEREQTLNQILVEMDGFEKGTRVVVIGATNRPDVLDPALLRPGRFDRKIVLDLPDVKAREEILKIHLRDKRVGKVNLKQIAELTPGFSGADLANLCNEAAILAARRNKEFIEQEDLLDSIEKVLLGPERKTKVYSKKEKEIAAYHEAGHALVAHYLPFASPVQKISIIARGKAGGYTLKTPLEERSFYFKKEFLDELASMLGGYAAEKLIYNDITTGASNDLEIATDLARQLVLKFGMSEKLGPISFSRTPREFYLEKEYSEKTAEIIDEEVKRIIDKALERALKVLTLKKDKLEKVAKVLMKEEVIEKRRFERLVGEKKGSINVN